jgi:hypothetical protein
VIFETVVITVVEHGADFRAFLAIQIIFIGTRTAAQDHIRAANRTGSPGTLWQSAPDALSPAADGARNQ